MHVYECIDTIYRGSQTFSLEPNLSSVDPLFNPHGYFQMSWSTMEELVEESAPTEEEDRILDRLKLLAQESLLEGWKNWTCQWKIYLVRSYKLILKF